MGLDYTNGCVNFRDFGAYVNLIAETPLLPEKKLYRGGSIDYVLSLTEIENVQSILNLRQGPDPMNFDIDYYHFPMANKVEKYHTEQKTVRLWLNTILQLFEDNTLQFPILIHCLSGKDRTGIVVAALLSILEIPKEIIKEEYLLSKGNVQEEWIQMALNGFEDYRAYFNRVDIETVVRNVLGV